MAVLKCKMCGGDLNITADEKIVECEFCGTTQTIPNGSDEKKTNLFNRANRLRIANEFDKAAGIYESIIAEFPEEAEAYWGLCLCKFGIEYVDDPKTAKKIPTCHRTSFESIFDDENYKMAIEKSDVIAQGVYNEADIAILFVNPSSGDYFTATAGYLELDICEGKEVPNVDDFCRPMKETHLETTLTGVHKLSEIAAAVHAKGGKVISNINFPLAWLVGNVERNVDVLLAGFETYPAATLDVIFGRYNPTGKLPITLPKGDEVLAVNENGVCISPNDVPGYDKDQYMPAELKDENGKAYAYRDGNGNYYELNFGLSY